MVYGCMQRSLINSYVRTQDIKRLLEEKEQGVWNFNVVFIVLTVSFVPSAENPKMALSTPRDPTTEVTMIAVFSILTPILLSFLVRFLQRHKRERDVESLGCSVSHKIDQCMFIWMCGDLWGKCGTRTL
jgi:hypothetical protein